MALGYEELVFLRGSLVNVIYFGDIRYLKVVCFSFCFGILYYGVVG